MKLIIKSGYALLAASAALAACVSCGPKGSAVESVKGSEVDYSLSMFRNTLSVVPADKNVTVSPYSAGVALSMLAEGAEGKTLAELDKALLGCRFEAEDFVINDSVVVKSANSLWTNDKYQIKKNYVELLGQKYDAKAEALDFSSLASVEKINAWARENTEGKIQKAIDELNPQMVAVLSNALYFKGTWQYPFDGESTLTKTFHGNSGDSQVSFMNQTATFQFAEYYGNQMIVLPYFGGQYAMTVILPSEGIGTEGVQRYLHESYLDMAKDKLADTRVRLSLPKFKIEGDMSLIPVLQKMGVETAFTPAAELGRIAEGPLSVSEVNQKTFVNVDERGSEAAAVTTVGIRLTSAPVKDFNVKVMDVNRPFYYMISNLETGRILFIGRISNLK